MDKKNITVLVVEDDADIRAILRFQLAKEGYRALVAADGNEGLATAQREKPQLVILDLMLPGMDGMAVCRRLRASPATDGILILMLTARHLEEDVVSGLEAGADDYVAKPFSNRVLLARVRSLLRRASILDGTGEENAAGETLRAGGIELRHHTMEVRVDGEKVELTAGEFKMLAVMMRRPGVVFTRGQLLDLVRGHFHAVTDRAVDVQVAGLRRKLGRAGDMVETVRGAGYRMAAEG